MKNILECAVCKKPYTEKGQYYICPGCGGSIEHRPDYEVDGERYRRILQKGSDRGIFGYEGLLGPGGLAEPVSLMEGNTPLLRAKRLEAVFGMKTVYLKNETLNPTGTYKDRFAAAAVSIEKAKGTKAIALGSAGNAAAAVSAYAAAAGIPCYVLLPEEAVQERAWQIMAYGAGVIRMDGTIDECIQMAIAGEQLFGWKNVTTTMRYHPDGVEGYKTIAYEIARQLHFKMPDWLICPVGGGSLLSKIYRGCYDMLKLGLIDRIPKFAAVQAKGCCPLVKAFEEGRTETSDWGRPSTIAFALADVCTYEGVNVLHILRKTKGTAVSVSDDEILRAMRLLASREAVLAEPSSAAAVAGLNRLLEREIVRKEETAVCLITGSAMRDLRLLGGGISVPDTVSPITTENVKRAVDFYKRN